MRSDIDEIVAALAATSLCGHGTGLADFAAARFDTTGGSSTHASCNDRPVVRTRSSTPTSILDALGKAGLDVPTLCQRPASEAGGRLPNVHRPSRREVTRLVTACNHPVANGMVIETSTPEIHAQRRALLRLLAHDYPADAIATAIPTKNFTVGSATTTSKVTYVAPGNPHSADDSHPHLRVDFSQCIDCFRCVRICDDVQGQFVWRVWNRGAETRFDPTRIPPCSKARA